MIPSKEPVRLPPLPQVSGDPSILFDVFTHRSISTSNREYGNGDRLAHIGATIFQHAVVDHWFSRRPMLSVEEMEAKKFEAMGDTKVMYWVSVYDFKRRISFGSQGSTILNTPSESRWFFNAYIGALYTRDGLEAVKKWISGLIDPDFHGSGDKTPSPEYTNWTNFRPSSPGSSTAVSQPEPPTYYRSQTTSRASPPGSPHTPKPPTPPQSPPTGSRVLVTVSHFNEVATRKGRNVYYADSSEGPSHLPIWT
ncbi:hypothetical protein BD779DRAFT_648532 [Infundibulicybe gibba]|nr:hypothetical protein BD779DRAFT_648532 [Infundibulicybe gibba]